MQSELALQTCASQIVGDSERSVEIDKDLRDEEQRYAARPGGRVGQAGQHQMNDVLRQVVIAKADVDLLPGDRVGAVSFARRPRG